ncbi:hypothetical protein H257_17240 [Aphanomyces astaci]|uniref:Uncharacterized protein n=1 Tax=Aphanomyces astaci TaxID=112090 RepID=W4FHH2_APHAT|nr:hypothetical protein H257_17240 [Aphanomyces astaci]ETV66271.1 hypothetical protein H257_17240 [Aphanomyces astaci]|eukprot:XP_009844258.1 hypothetical protein H257_17240 [Aphanomyces astaci]
MVVGRERSVSAVARTESRSQKRRKQRGRIIPQPDPGAANMDHSSAGMTPPPTARPRGPADTSVAQDENATPVSSVGGHAALAEQATTQVSDDRASPYSFLRMHTVLSHGIVDLPNSIQRNERSLRVLQEVRAAMASTLGSGPHDMSQARHALVDEVEFLTATLSEVNAEVLDLRTALDSSRRALDTAHAERDGTHDLLQEAQESLRSLEQGQHDLREQRDQAQVRLNDQQAELRDLTSRLTAQTEKATELGHRVQEADQALEVMTAEVNDARNYTAHSARLVAGKEGVVKLALQNKSLVVAEMSDLRRSLEDERENSEKARQDRDRALTTAGELQEQLRVAQDRLAQLEAQPPRFSASNPAWDILLAENQDLREAAKTQKARAKDFRVKNKILRSQIEAFQADALRKLGALESRVQGYASQDRRHREELAQLEEKERADVGPSLLHANEHFQDAVPSFWDWVAQHLQVSGAAGVAPLIEAWTSSDPDHFKSCNETVGIFPAKAARGLTEPLLGRVRGPTFSAWVNTALPVMRDALKESSTPSPGVPEADVVEAPSGSGAKGSTLPGPAVAKAHDPNLPRDVDATYLAVASSKPWEQYKAEESFIHSSWRRLPLWAELQGQLEDFWENHVLAHWNRRFMRGSAEVNAEVEAAMGPLVGIIGCLYRILRRHGTDLLRFLCYPHSYWPDFLRDGVSLKMMASVQGARSVQEYLSSQGSEFWPEVPSTSRTEPFDPPFMATLAFLKGRSLREFWLKKFDPLNPANCSRERVSRVLTWLYAQAEECRRAGAYQGRFPFVVGDRSHPPEGSQWARGMPRPAGIPPAGHAPPFPHVTGVPKTDTTFGASPTLSASGVQSPLLAPEMVDLLSNSATDTDEETVIVDL